MIFIISILIGLSAGIISKGKLSNIKSIKINKPWIIILGCFIQALARISAIKGVDFAIKYSLIIQCVIFALILISIWLNRQYIGILIIGIGFLMNNVVMALNGGKMPVFDNLFYQDGRHIMADKSTILPFLGDYIKLPGFFNFLSGAMSPGDLIIAVGVGILTFELTRDKAERENKKLA